MRARTFAGQGNERAPLAAIRERRKEVGIVIKLETQQGFRELPDLLLALLTHSPVGLMIARGDLARHCRIHIPRQARSRRASQGAVEQC